VLSVDLIGAIERLSHIDPDWLKTVERAETIHKLRGQDIVRIANALMIDRRGAELVAKLLQESDDPAHSRSTLRLLALIGTGDYSGAIRTWETVRRFYNLTGSKEFSILRAQSGAKQEWLPAICLSESWNLQARMKNE
jgi:hypothetical protein